jgi:uncharacterized protein (UPF0332 family)
MNGTKEDIIKYRIEKSLDTFEDAKALALLERWRNCVMLLYYSSFYLIDSIAFEKWVKS